MGRTIIKVAKDRDAYIEWSSVVEAPVAFGTREDFLTYRGAEPRGWIASRFDRADQCGTSAMFFGWLPPEQQEGGWEDPGLIYMQRGVLPRNRMSDLYDLLMADANAEIPSDWLIPFEDREGGTS